MQLSDPLFIFLLATPDGVSVSPREGNGWRDKCSDSCACEGYHKLDSLANVSTQGKRI